METNQLRGRVGAPPHPVYFGGDIDNNDCGSRTVKINAIICMITLIEKKKTMR